MADAGSLRDARGDGLDYVRHRYDGRAQRGRRVTVYTGEVGTILGSHKFAEHYLSVLMDGDTEPIILHPTWKIAYHDEVRDV